MKDHHLPAPFEPVALREISLPGPRGERMVVPYIVWEDMKGHRVHCCSSGMEQHFDPAQRVWRETHRALIYALIVADYRRYEDRVNAQLRDLYAAGWIGGIWPARSARVS